MATSRQTEMTSFWTTASVRPSWLFKVTFPDSNGLSKLNNHIVSSVRLPTINTTEEKYLKASKLYPDLFVVFDLSNGIDFEINFTENLTNDVEKVRWGYYRNLITQTKKEGGIFYAPPLSEARYVDGGEGIVVDIIDDDGDVSFRYIFKKCILSNVSGTTYGYDSSEKVTQSFTFKAMSVETYFDDGLLAEAN